MRETLKMSLSWPAALKTFVLCLALLETVTSIEVKARCSDTMKFYADGVLKATHTSKTTTKDFTLPDSTEIVGIECKADKATTLGGIFATFRKEVDGDYQTDNTWRCNNKFKDGWMKNDFDDSSWLYAITTADNSKTTDGLNKISSIKSYTKWIWTSGSNIKTGDSTVYCRGYPKVSQTHDSYGRRFVIGFMDNRKGSPRKDIKLLFTTLSPTNVFVRIITPLLTSSSSLMVDDGLFVIAGEVKTKTLPQDLRHYTTDISKYGLLVVATDPVKIIGINQEKYSTDMMLMIPITSLGPESISNTYYTVNWDDSNDARVLIVSGYDNTIVNVNSHKTFEYQGNDKTSPQVITLNEFESVQLKADDGFTGTLIKTSKPATVYSGNRKAKVSNSKDGVKEKGTSSDHLVEQLLPTRNWGKFFIITPLPYFTDYIKGRIGNNLEKFKYIAAEDNTNIQIRYYKSDSTPIDTKSIDLNAGKFKDMEHTRGNHAVVTSNKGIMIAQFATTMQQTGKNCMGDPWLQIIPPVAEFSRDYGLLTPKLEDSTSCPAQHFVTILVKKDKKAGITIDQKSFTWDKNSGAVDVGGTDYVYITKNLEYDPVQGRRIQHTDTSVSFGVYFFGYGRYDSYATMGGSRTAPINEECTITTQEKMGDGIDNNCDGKIDEDSCNTINDHKDCGSPSPVNGQWGSWDIEGSCGCTASSKVGDKALQTYKRKCDNPSPKHNGYDCTPKEDGTKTETCTCEKKDGGWGNWSSWDQCTELCGGGKRSRDRKCINPIPSLYPKGADCSGNGTDSQSCNVVACPSWNNWKNWSTCSCKSGTYSGTQQRSRTCNIDPSLVGKAYCPDSGNISTQSCNCPKDGYLQPWTLWGSCNKSCGGGIQTKTRSCVAPLYGGKPCSNDTLKRQTCNTEACPYWSEYSSCVCNAGVYNGTKRKDRTCQDPAPQQNKGANCTNSPVTTSACNCPKHGEWNAWKVWSQCSKTCGSGSKRRNRTCTDPMYGGNPCSGPVNETQACNTGGCPYWAEWGSWGSCNCLSGVYDGNTTRSRQCKDPAPTQNNNAPCLGKSTNQTSCNCPKDAVVSLWSNWKSCSKLCDSGQQNRTRTCQPPLNGGVACPQTLNEFQDCNTHGCPVWKNWSDYGNCVCPANIWDGVKTRTRICDLVSSQNKHTCSGSSNSTASCKCPRDGAWSNFGSWSTCTKSCKNGTWYRNRTCTNPSPLNNGEDCKGSAGEVEPCNTQPCPINGGWSDFKVVDGGKCVCPDSSLDGVVTNKRTCTNPEPQYGGDDCIGNDKSTEDCKCLTVNEAEAQEAEEQRKAAEAQALGDDKKMSTLPMIGAGAGVGALVAASCLIYGLRRRKKKKEEEKLRPKTGSREADDITPEDLEGGDTLD